MSSLTQFRDHCRTMAAADHKPECPSLPKNQPYWAPWASVFGEDGDVEALRWNGPPPKPPTCAGCLTDADRALFAQMAAEVDDLSNFRRAHQTCREAWAAKQAPPGPCWHDSGYVNPHGWPFRCELQAGHEGAHECDRGPWGGRSVWTDEEAMTAEPPTLAVPARVEPSEEMG